MQGKGSGDPAYFVAESLEMTSRVGEVAKDDGDDDESDRQRYCNCEIKSALRGLQGKLADSDVRRFDKFWPDCRSCHVLEEILRWSRYDHIVRVRLGSTEEHGVGDAIVFVRGGGNSGVS